MPCSNHPQIQDAGDFCSRCERPFCPDCMIELGGLAYCASCKLEHVRDIHSGVDPTRLELASLERRLTALCLDGALLATPFCMGLMFLPAAFAGGAGAPTTAFTVLLSFGTAWLSVGYEGLLLARSGQTPGKKAVGIRVVTAEGGELRPGQAWGRGLARALLGTLLVDYVPAFFTRERICLHDLLARTRVVRWRP